MPNEITKDSFHTIEIEQRIYRVPIIGSKLKANSNAVEFEQYDDEIEEEESNRIPSVMHEVNEELENEEAVYGGCVKRLEGNEEDPSITLHISGKYELLLPLSSVFYGYIIGKSGKTKEKIETGTGTTITIPKKNVKENEEIIRILGPTKAAVASAKTRIEIIVATSRASLGFTHFVCLPLTFLKNEVQKYFEQINSDPEVLHAKGYHQSLCSPPEKLHVTVLVLKAFGKAEIEAAKQVFQKCQSICYDALRTRTALASFKGLEYMNDDPSAVDVVYLQVIDNSGRIESMCNSMIEEFKKNNIAIDQRPLKIHATLFNTIRTGENSTEQQSSQSSFHKGRISFDARPLFKKYNQIDLGQHKIEEIRLCSMQGVDNDGFYKCVDKIKLP